MKELLEEHYLALLNKYGFAKQVPAQDINLIIKDSLYEFVNGCSVPAIWCYGNHTKMLMTDFIYQMKGVNYIIDANYPHNGDSGFQIIGEEEIRERKIDGVVISSYRYREEIKENLRKNYPGIRYLDIYEKLEENGFVLKNEYYMQTHPYGHYLKINEYRRKLADPSLQNEKTELCWALLEEYIVIKDFRTAINCLREYMGADGFDRNGELLEDLQSLYDLEIEAAFRISEHNVLMLCIDGLRNRDVKEGYMPGLAKYISEKGYAFQNAYSVSTSTYESLIPAYSENLDLRTKYYESVTCPEESCRFILEARKQKRNVFFYTDSVKYIDSDLIHPGGKLQTATEKFWDFILDAQDEENGLFYLHVLYESHFSYPNPYTCESIIAEGTSILFDYLSGNGGGIRADYDNQHRDALRYLDDVMMPFIEPLKCRMVIYADHGNIILEKDEPLKSVEYTKFTFHRDLIQIPLVVKSPETGSGENDELCSIAQLNQIIISLMKEEKVCRSKKDYVKVVRSEIYNPDFKFLYQRCGYSQGLLAFEVFIFDSGHKLAVYSNGASELYEAHSDRKLEDDGLKDRLLRQVKEQITVCV